MENLKFTIEDYSRVDDNEICVSIILFEGLEMTFLIQQKEFWKWVDDNDANYYEKPGKLAHLYDERDPAYPYIECHYNDDEFFKMVPEMNDALIYFLTEKVFEPLNKIIQSQTTISTK